MLVFSNKTIKHLLIKQLLLILDFFQLKIFAMHCDCLRQNGMNIYTFKISENGLVDFPGRCPPGAIDVTL